MSFNLATVMDGIASYAVAQNVVAKAYGTPIPNPTPPCLIVGYPVGTYDLTFTNSGADELTFPLWFVVAPIADVSARNAMSAVISPSATGVKWALDGSLGGLVSSARVKDFKVESMTIGSVEYLAVHFELEVLV